MKLRTLFSGIGAPESALKNLGIDYELVDFCEIDKYAVKSYCAIHGVDESKNLGDISKVWGRDLPYADLLVWGFPCTDISVAGKQAGIVEGETRSGLYYEGLRILRETKPKYSIIENVKNLTGKQFKAEFEQMLKDIEQLGYSNYWKVLNAKNYGIPQNRERVFIVSIRNDIDTGFEFPQGFDNGLRLKDFLENVVEEKFYISQEKTEKLITQIKQNNPNTSYETSEADGVYTGTSLKFTRSPLPGLSRTLKANMHDAAVCIPCITPDREEKRQNDKTGKEDGEPMFTLTGQDRHGVLQVGKIEGKNYNQNKVVYSDEGISPTIHGQGHCGNEPKVLQIGNIVDTGNWDNPQAGRIYSPEGLSPTLNTCGGGQREPKILRPERTEYGKAIRKQYEAGEVEESRHNMTELHPREDGISNTLTTVQKDNLILEPKVAIKEATKQGYAIAEEGDSINIQFPNSETRRGRVGKECAQTLETSCNQAVLVPSNELKFIGGVNDKDWVGDGKKFSRNYPQGNRVYDSEGIACSQTAQGGGIGSFTGLYADGYRIRKLTPRECWRLMGFSDEEFQKCVDAGVSNSQLYKQAGNSIVTNVLYYIFKNLLKEVKKC